MYNLGAGDAPPKKVATMVGCRANTTPNATQLIAFARITGFRLNIIASPMYT